jgi:hypothetical protein
MNKDKKDERLDRHSGTGQRGLAKKGGHAGKFGWGKEGTGEGGEAAIDENDPNYISDEEEPTEVQQKQKQERQVKAVVEEIDQCPAEDLIRDFFKYEDMEELSKSVEKFLNPKNHPRFIKKCIFAAMDRQSYERELVSNLFPFLEGRVVSALDFEIGFQQALIALDDITLDNPNATDILSKFIARAIVDEVVPPVFLTKVEVLGEKANTCLALASALSTEHLSGERLQRIWGPGDLRSVKRLKKEVSEMLLEFLINEDLSEAEKSIRKLNAPSFHFQIVKLALRFMLEKTEEQISKLFRLMSYLKTVQLISLDHFEQGFDCCWSSVDDYKLDVPNAVPTLQKLTDQAKKEGWLSESFKPTTTSK